MRKHTSFNPVELHIIERAYQAAWALILARHPNNNLESNEQRQQALRKRLLILANRGPVDFELLRDRVLATMPESLMSYGPKPRPRLRTRRVRKPPIPADTNVSSS